MHDDVPGEGIDTFKSHVLASRNEGPLIGGIGGGGLDEGEVRRAFVVQDQETVLAADDHVVDAVLDSLPAGQHDGELGFRVGGVGDTDLGGDG